MTEKAVIGDYTETLKQNNTPLKFFCLILRKLINVENIPVGVLHCWSSKDDPLFPLCNHIYQPLSLGMIWHKVNF